MARDSRAQRRRLGPFGAPGEDYVRDRRWWCGLAPARHIRVNRSVLVGRDPS
jgi:hypothetical protein